MFGADNLVAFPGADALFIGIVVVIYIAAIYLARNFVKKF